MKKMRMVNPYLSIIIILTVHELNSSIKDRMYARHQWLTPVILANQETGIRRITV
jgi:hypothetical protein